jgi:hypothetical protein
MIVTLGVVGVLSSIAVVQISQSIPPMKADGGMRVVLAQMNQARQMAITQRRYIRVTFTAPNSIQIIREDTPVTTTTLSTVRIEGGVEFGLISGVPDTPDAFGNSGAISFGSVTNVKFTPEGTLVNQDGQSTNGSVFVAIPQNARSARAVTVLGSTGRIRGYRWDGTNWKLV